MALRFRPALHRLARLLVLLFALLVALSALAYLARDPLRQWLADATGEEDFTYQLKALGYQGVALAQPPPQTADDVPVRYNDGSPFGINTFLEQEVEEPKVRRSLELIRDAGLHWVRQEFPWEDLEQPGKSQFWDTKFNHSTWDKYDRIVSLAQEYGLELVVRLDHPPAWTRHDGRARGDFAPPDNFDDYGDFVAAVVTRYKGRVRYYQLWNEPNIYPEWGEQPVDASAYTRLLKIGYARAKAADPDCVILSAGLAQNIEAGGRNQSDLTFLEEMYAAGAQSAFDILAVQDYGLFSGPGDRRVEADRTNFSRPILLREIMVRHGDATKPIWAMEIGWNAAPDTTEAIYGRVTETQQARYAVQAYRRAADEWPWMGPMMYWFFKRADDHEVNQPFYFFRMFEPDFTPHPVYGALRDYIAAARFVGLGFHSVEHWAMTWAGDWNRVRDGSVPFGVYAVGAPGARVSFAWRGTDLALAVANPYVGSVRVQVDGRDWREFDLKDTDSHAYRQITVAPDLPDGDHRAEITVVQGPAAIEGFAVRRSAGWLWPAGALALAMATAAACLAAIRRRA